MPFIPTYPPEAQKEMEERCARILRNIAEKKLAALKIQESKWKRKKKPPVFKKMNLPKDLSKLTQAQLVNLLKELTNRLTRLEQSDYFEGETWKKVLGIEEEQKFNQAA